MAVGFGRDTTTKRNKTKRGGRGTRKTREKVKLVIGETRGIRPIRERERKREGATGEITRRDAKESASFGRGTNDKEYL